MPKEVSRLSGGSLRTGTERVTYAAIGFCSLSNAGAVSTS